MESYDFCQSCEYQGGCSLCEKCKDGKFRKDRQGEINEIKTTDHEI